MVGALAERRHRGQRAVDMTSATIAVVGAGPVGLTAALALADAGQDIALIAPTKPPADRRTSALLVGVGTRIGRGCTSGHGICGLSRLSVRSFVAVGTFMVTAMITVFIVRHVV